MFLPNAIICAFALFKVGSAGAKLADPVKPAVTSAPLDDVHSCLLDTEGCGLFRRPVFTTIGYGRYWARVEV